MVSESTGSNTELSEFVWPSLSSGGELSEFNSAHYLCAKVNSPSFLWTEFDAELSEFSLSKQYSVSFLETRRKAAGNHHLSCQATYSLLQRNFSSVATQMFENSIATFTALSSGPQMFAMLHHSFTSYTTQLFNCYKAALKNWQCNFFFGRSMLKGRD